MTARPHNLRPLFGFGTIWRPMAYWRDFLPANTQETGETPEPAENDEAAIGALASESSAATRMWAGLYSYGIAGME